MRYEVVRTAGERDVEDILEWFRGLRERFSDPFLFATTLSWAIFNWRFFVVLFHEGAPDSRGAIVDLAAAQLSWNWTCYHLVNRSIALALAVGVGFAYARWYPVLRGRFKVERARIDANASRDAAKEGDRATGELSARATSAS